jgi:peptidoglycan/xylan/chitin deacetylase (PgdA/CDA1 family)
MHDFLCNNVSGISNEISRSVTCDTCLILQYHRVASLCFDPFQLAVEPYNFEGQIEYLARNFNVISMDELKQHLETSRPFEERSIVITFDGGYADVLYTAKDVLDRFAVPATVFASSADIMERRQVWWKELEDYLIANSCGGQLEVEIDGRFRRWPLSTQFDRFRACEELYSIASNKTVTEQRAIIEQITANLDLCAEELDDHRTMSADELRKVTQGEMITVGGHTHSYVKLSRLPKWQQIEEVSRNKEILQEVLGREVEYFAYPFGNDDGYTPETMRILQDAGFVLACGGSYGTVSATRGDGLYDLPRVKVGNWSTFAFHRFLRRFLE